MADRPNKTGNSNLVRVMHYVLSQRSRSRRYLLLIFFRRRDGYCAGPQAGFRSEWRRYVCFRFAAGEIAGGSCRIRSLGGLPPLFNPPPLIAAFPHDLYDVFRTGQSGDWKL